MEGETTILIAFKMFIFSFEYLVGLLNFRQPDLALKYVKSTKLRESKITSFGFLPFTSDPFLTFWKLTYFAIWGKTAPNSGVRSKW